MCSHQLTGGGAVFQVPSSDRRSYMLLPLYANVLLESTNVADHIVTFRGARRLPVSSSESVDGGR